MNRKDMLKKVQELFEKMEELADYGFYTNHELAEIKSKTLENFRKIWNIK